MEERPSLILKREPGPNEIYRVWAGDECVGSIVRQTGGFDAGGYFWSVLTPGPQDASFRGRAADRGSQAGVQGGVDEAGAACYTGPMPLTFVNDGHIARSGDADIGQIIKRPDGGWFWSIAVIKSNPPMQGTATSKEAAQKELRAKWAEWLE